MVGIWKLILSILMIFSAILMIYPKTSRMVELTPGIVDPEVRATVGRLWMETFGIALIHFIIFCILWSIPDAAEATREE